MDKKGKFEKMVDMMKSRCTGEEDMADCCSMMRKMMEFCEGEEEKEEKKKKKEDTGEAE